MFIDIEHVEKMMQQLPVAIELSFKEKDSDLAKEADKRAIMLAVLALF